MLTLEAPARVDPALGGDSTLDELIASAWEGLTARHVVACVVCGAPMAPSYGADGEAREGRCQGCGCSLS